MTAFLLMEWALRSKVALIEAAMKSEFTKQGYPLRHITVWLIYSGSNADDGVIDATGCIQNTFSSQLPHETYLYVR